MSRRPQGEKEAILKDMSKMLKRPRTVDHLSETLEVDECTIYRYLKSLQKAGLNVSRIGLDRPVKYQII